VMRIVTAQECMAHPTAASRLPAVHLPT
jgi:hypothetical protein